MGLDPGYDIPKLICQGGGSLTKPDSHTKSEIESGQTHILSWC